MFLSMLLSGVVSSVLIFLYILWYFFMKNYFIKNKKKESIYECGFTSKNRSRLPFSLRFFVLLLLFIVFDVELSFLLQMPFQWDSFFLKNRELFFVFFSILFLGLLEEWRRGLLDWNS